MKFTKLGILAAVVICFVFGLVYGDKRFRDASGRYEVDQRVEIDDSTFLRRVASIPYAYIVASNLTPGLTPFHVMGRNADVSITPEDLSDVGGIVALPDTHMFMVVKSNDGNDSTAGTGALEIEIHYLDSLWNPGTLTKLMTGSQPGTLSVMIRRINDAHVTTTGGAGWNVGTITIENLAEDTIYSIIGAKLGSAEQAVRTIPNGQTGFITGFSGGMTNKAGEVRLMANVDKITGERTDAFISWASITSLDASSQHFFIFPIPLIEKTDFKLMAVSVSMAGGDATGTIEGWLRGDN